MTDRQAGVGRVMGDEKIPYIANRPVVNEGVRSFGFRRLAWVVLGVVIIWVLVTVFSRWESGVAWYSAPEAVCGVDVSPAVLTPLLPPGRRLEQHEPQVPSSKEWTAEFCKIYVDQELVLSFDAEIFSEVGRGVTEVYHGISVPSEVLIGGEPAVLGHNGSLSRAMCPARGEEAVLQVNIKYFDAEGGSALDEERELMKALTEEYLGAVAKRHGCA